jgi:hypothetical protein
MTRGGAGTGGLTFEAACKSGESQNRPIQNWIGEYPSMSTSFFDFQCRKNFQFAAVHMEGAGAIYKRPSSTTRIDNDAC